MCASLHPSSMEQLSITPNVITLKFYHRHHHITCVLSFYVIDCHVRWLFILTDIFGMLKRILEECLQFLSFLNSEISHTPFLVKDKVQCTNMIKKRLLMPIHGPLSRSVKLWVAHAPGMPGMFSPPLRVSDPGMHHGTWVAVFWQEAHGLLVR